MGTIGTSEERKGKEECLCCVSEKGDRRSEMQLARPNSDYSLQAQSRPRLTVEIIVGYFGQQDWDE